MKIWNISLFLGILATLTINNSVLGEISQGRFTFNETISNLWIGTATVSYDPDAVWYPSRNCGGSSSCLAVMPKPKYGITRVNIPVHTARCPNQYHIKHIVTAHFKGSGDGWFKRSTIIEGSREENRDMNISLTANGYYGEPQKGNLSLEVRTECVYHGVNNRGGPPWAPWNW